MNIAISITLDGPDDWTERENAFGQTVRETHTFTVALTSECPKQTALVSALVRLLDAVDPPRKGYLLAELVEQFAEDLKECVEEQRFVRSAFDVVRFWQRTHTDEKGARNGDAGA